MDTTLATIDQKLTIATSTRIDDDAASLQNNPRRAGGAESSRAQSAESLFRFIHPI
jgi:hypothetical protein